MIIYKVTNLIDGTLYIGQTTQKLNKRWNDHCYRKDKNNSHYFFRAIQKYGKENFLVEQIDSAQTLEGLNALEEMYIKKFNCLAPNGYNLVPGGLNHACHPDTRAKISQKLKGKPIINRWTGGNTQSPSEETRSKISRKLKGRAIENRWTGGNTKPRTEEQKAYLSALNKGKPNTALNKAIVVVETNTTYASINIAAKALGLSRATISMYLKSGEQHKKTGLTFVFADIINKKED